MVLFYVTAVAETIAMGDTNCLEMSRLRYCGNEEIYLLLNFDQTCLRPNPELCLVQHLRMFSPDARQPVYEPNYALSLEQLSVVDDGTRIDRATYWTFSIHDKALQTKY